MKKSVNQIQEEDHRSVDPGRRAKGCYLLFKLGDDGCELYPVISSSVWVSITLDLFCFFLDFDGRRRTDGFGERKSLDRPGSSLLPNPVEKIA